MIKIRPETHAIWTLKKKFKKTMKLRIGSWKDFDKSAVRLTNFYKEKTQIINKKENIKMIPHKYKKDYKKQIWTYISQQVG